jgi:hypothetical protein
MSKNLSNIKGIDAIKAFVRFDGIERKGKSYKYKNAKWYDRYR